LRAVKAGASAFIMKPFREETLLQAVAQALVQSRNGKQTRNSKGRHS